MMTTPDMVALRTVFVNSLADARVQLPTDRLLRDLGHEVTTTGTLDGAMQLLEEGPVDLLILEEESKGGQPADMRFKERVLDRLDTLPVEHRPKEIAIYSDRADDSVSALRRRPGAPRVHVLFKPLHMHGLLQVLRSLESKAAWDGRR